MTVTQRIKEICFKYPERTALQVKDSKGVFQPYLYKTLQGYLCNRCSSC